MRKKRVLVIDDEESFCTFVGAALGERDRYRVVSATEPLRGITMARTLRPDLILIDLDRPRMDGSQVAEKLLGDTKTESIPIVFVTWLVTKEETNHRQLIVAGRIFVAKPVTMDELAQAVGRILMQPGSSNALKVHSRSVADPSWTARPSRSPLSARVINPIGL